MSKLINKPKHSFWRRSEAWKQGRNDALLGLESNNPYGYRQWHKMMQYNDGYWCIYSKKNRRLLVG